MLLDVYFFTRLPVLGVIDDTISKITHGVSLEDLRDRHCYASASMHSSYILVCYIERLDTQFVVVMVLRILGSLGPYKISGDQPHMVEHFLRGTYFGWA